ncbi:hypothetical protein bas03_0044 [Escherichia phage JulesPiccard]|uniref:Uncharacterized protein n=1 Tax=Escherichia phage JulesPiccard TaxID=2851956 RepID=A0AAE7VV22_9CAUD|nr:hypothetical protein bas03_0044 [Escherichia phage JulesPiccard]
MREAIVNWKNGEDSKFFFNTLSQYIDKIVFVIDGGCEVIVPIKLIDGLGVSE